MPTILRLNGFRFFFYSNENEEEPHIHVEKSGGVAKLATLGKVRLLWIRGFNEPEAARILKITELYQNEFLNAWYVYFDPYK